MSDLCLADPIGDVLQHLRAFQLEHHLPPRMVLCSRDARTVVWRYLAGDAPEPPLSTPILIYGVPLFAGHVPDDELRVFGDYGAR